MQITWHCGIVHEPYLRFGASPCSELLHCHKQRGQLSLSWLIVLPSILQLQQNICLIKTYHYSMESSKRYGAAISETLTWEGGWFEVSLTQFFFSVYLWVDCRKNNILWNNLAFFCISHHCVTQFVVLSLNSSHFELWHGVTWCDRSWFVCVCVCVCVQG